MSGSGRTRVGLMVLAGLCAAPAARAQAPVVAVFGIENKGTRLEQGDLDRLSDYIGASLTESGRYQVVPREELKQALDRQKAASYKQCYAQSCQLEIGKELAAEKSLAGTVSRFGKRCIVSLTLFDLAKATQEAAGTADGKCDEDEVFASVKTALGKLTGRARGPGPSRGGLAATVVPEIQGADYGDVDAEIRAAAQKAAREAAERKAREKAAEADWDKIQRWVTNEGLAPERRIEILEKFLASFATDNPRAEDANALLKKLRGGVEMVLVPAGEFFMGCNTRVDAECDADEKPGRTVHLPAFLVDKTEVTVAAYRACVDAGGCSASGVDVPFFKGTLKPKEKYYCNWTHNDRAQHPMNCVDWSQARTYCQWLGKRLPTEQEWEKAARGTDGRKYPWGNQGYGSRRVANTADKNTKQWFDYALPSYDDGAKISAAVGSYPAGASPYGLLDMAGNVWEWTSDEDLGGSWFSRAKRTRASDRNRISGDDKNNDVGFRCVQSP